MELGRGGVGISPNLSGGPPETTWEKAVLRNSLEIQPLQPLNPVLDKSLPGKGSGPDEEGLKVQTSLRALFLFNLLTGILA